MDSSELSLVKFQTLNFFSIILNARPFQPISTLLIKIVEALLSSENEPDEKLSKRVNWIYKNTHKKVNENISIVELAVFRNLDKGLNREIEIGNKSFYLTELYKYLDEVSKELTKIVIEIAKKYSVEITFPTLLKSSGDTQTISI